MQSLRTNRTAARISALLLAILITTVVLRWLEWNRFRPIPMSAVAYARQFLSAIVLTGLTAGAIITFAPAGARKWLQDTPQRRRRARWIVALLILIYIAVYGYFTFQRHYHFNSAGYDLGIQSQLVWNTAHGRWYATSVEVHNYLGDHFKPLVAIFAPLYYFWPTPYWLIGFQTIALSLGAIPVYRLASRRLESPLAGIVFAAVYLLYPSVGYINRFDFHWEATVIPLFLAAVDAADTGRWRLMSVWLILAILGKEEIGLTVAAFGLWLAWRRRYRPGLLWALLGVGFSLAALFLIIPAIRMAPSDTLGRYGWLGDSPLAMIQTIVTEPGLVVSHLFQRVNLSFILSLLGPLFFLPLLSSQILVVLPAVAYNLLSSGGSQHTVFFQYVSPIVPFLLTSAIYGAANLRQWAAVKKLNAEVTWLLLSGVFFFALWHVTAINNPLRDHAGFVSRAWTRLPNEEAVREGLAHVPAKGALFTSNHYVPHLAHRRTVYTYVFEGDESQIDEADVLFLNLQDHRAPAAPVDCDTYREYLERAKANGFGLVFREDGVLVLTQEPDAAPIPEPETVVAPFCRR